MKKGLILISVMAALFSNPLLADQISGGPRVSLDSGQLIVPCVAVDDPGSKFDGRYFDVKLVQNGTLYELIYVKEEDSEVCKQLIAASLNADEDTSDIKGNLGSTDTQATYKIGDAGPAGGIVFYVTDGGLHGLEAAPSDQGTTTQWGCDSITTGATGFAVETGADNTSRILADCSTQGIAARLAGNYVLNDYIDWFLPSIDELNELYLHKDIVGGFANVYYWSSTEDYSAYAWYQDFSDGNLDNFSKNFPLRVRAIRAF